MPIDAVTYDRPTVQTPAYGGFEVRKAPPTAIVVHSTSNPHQRNTAFEAEADFLFKTKLAGAHYLIGKDGRTVQFFDPLHWAAWHAGSAQHAYQNQQSIGIELHHSVGDPPYPQAQLGALGGLLTTLCAAFNIPFGLIDTHGQIAIAGPYIRKTDPSDWPHAEFIAWRNSLTTPRPMFHTVTAGPMGAVAQQDRRPDAPAAKYFAPGIPIACDDLTNGYFHTQEGSGFIPAGQVQA